MTKTTLPVSEAMTPILEKNNELSPIKSELVAAEVEKVKQQIDITNTAVIHSFGNEPKASLSRFTDSVLAQAKSQELEGEMEMLGNIVTEIEGLKIDKLGFGQWASGLPIIGDMIAYNMKKFELNFTDANQRIEQIVDQLTVKNKDMESSIVVLDELYCENHQLILSLDTYIRAGEEALHEFIQNTYKKLRSSAEQSLDPMDIQKVNDAEGQIVRFNTRLTNLHIVRNKAINTLPISRTLQDNYLQLKDDFNEIIHSVIPMWKNQFVLAIHARKQAKLINTSKSIKDQTNQQELDFAKSMVEINDNLNEQIGRGVLDKETLLQSTQATVHVINSHKERMSKVFAEQQQTKDAIELAQEDLKQALLNSSKLGQSLA